MFTYICMKTYNRFLILSCIFHVFCIHHGFIEVIFVESYLIFFISDRVGDCLGICKNNKFLIEIYITLYKIYFPKKMCTLLMVKFLWVKYSTQEDDTQKNKETEWNNKPLSGLILFQNESRNLK